MTDDFWHWVVIFDLLATLILIMLPPRRDE